MEKKMNKKLKIALAILFGDKFCFALLGLTLRLHTILFGCTTASSITLSYTYIIYMLAKTLSNYSYSSCVLFLQY